MIQRIQTIFLLLAAVAFGLLFKFPFASSVQEGQIFADGLYDVNDSPILLVLAGLGAVVSLISIFLFKNRSLQVRLSYLLIVLGILIAVMATVFYMGAEDLPASASIQDQAGMYLPIGSILFGILASVFIRKDEKLVRSADRLR